MADNDRKIAPMLKLPHLELAKTLKVKYAVDIAKLTYRGKVTFVAAMGFNYTAVQKMDVNRWCCPLRLKVNRKCLYNITVKYYHNGLAFNNLLSR